MGVGEKGGRAKSIRLQIPTGEAWVFLLLLSMGTITLQLLDDSISLLLIDRSRNYGGNGLSTECSCERGEVNTVVAKYHDFKSEPFSFH